MLSIYIFICNGAKGAPYMARGKLYSKSLTSIMPSPILDERVTWEEAALGNTAATAADRRRPPDGMGPPVEPVCRRRRIR